jgi:hypothetical protein
MAGYILDSTSSFPSPFATNISYPFANSSKPHFATQFSPHILSDVFDQSLHISAVFQNRTFDLFCLSCHIWIIYTRIELKSLITRSDFKTFSQWSREVSSRHVYLKTPEHCGTEEKSNWFHTIQYNSANSKIILILSDIYCCNSFKECLIK